jgi:hypothetical protein
LLWRPSKLAKPPLFTDLFVNIVKINRKEFFFGLIPGLGWSSVEKVMNYAV